MDSLTETKEFDKIKIAKGVFKYIRRNSEACSKPPTKKCSYCSLNHPLGQCPVCGKKCMDCGKINHFREVCRSRRKTAVYNIEQVTDQCDIEEDHIDMAKINSIIFISKCCAIAGNLKMLLNQVGVVISYKVDTGSNGNIMPLYLYKNYFLGQE